MTRILLTGVSGQLGHALQPELASLGEVIALDRTALDLTDPVAIRAVLESYCPDIIVNPAAYTAVDRAESEPALAYAINAQAPAVLAEWAAQQGALLVHYSTDYVFDGCKSAPYTEDDAPNPQSVYGGSKWQGEQAIRTTGARHLILRTSWVYGAYGNNFLKTILRLAQQRSELRVVDDQIGAPTSTALLAQVSAQLLREVMSGNALANGTFHLTASGVTSWHGYAQYLLELAEQAALPLQLFAADVAPIPSSDYPQPAPRPANSQLDCRKLATQFGIGLPAWQQGVKQVFNEIYPTTARTAS